jgi:hypothetical protein
LSKQDGPSRVEKEVILDAVLEETSGSQRASMWPRVGALAAVFAGVLVAVVLLRPPSEGEFRARGAQEEIAIEVSCEGGVCAQGARLLFEVTADPKYGYLAAFARRPDGAVLWYFPESESAASAAVGGLSAIVLGAEHVPGDYVLTVVLSEVPLDRAGVKRIVSGGGGAIVRELGLRIQ